MIMIKLESSWSCLVDLKGLLILINYNIEEKQAICNYLRSLCTKKKLIIIVMSLNEDETNRPRTEAVYFLSWIKQSVWVFLCFCLVFLFGSFNKVFKVASVLNSKLINSLFVSFFLEDPCPQPSQLKADSDQMEQSIPTIENCTRLQHYDYFSGSEISFPLTFIFLGLCVPGKLNTSLWYHYPLLSSFFFTEKG